MSLRSAGSINENCGGIGTVVKSGYLKKFKTYKKKFFVLRAETGDNSARLEYYDSERKFNNGQPPKRSIPIKTCFNINRRVDTKYKHVIALYTKDDCFSVVLESDEDLESWLKALLSLQHGEEVIDGEMPKPIFEHVWQVKVLNRGLGGSCLVSSRGQDSAIYRLCLTDKTLSLVKRDQEFPQTEFCLSSIRSCGNLKNYFYLEVGRSSSTGAGELWMETEDANIAQNVHHTVYHAMTTSSNSKEELGPKSRNRSSSATESTKSISRRQITPGSAKHYNIPTSTATVGTRERCDSMPSRPRTSSEGNHQMYPWHQQRPYHGSHRPQSFYGRDISYSPPTGSPLSPPSGACSTDSAGSSLSIDDTEHFPETDVICGRYGHSVTPDEAIAEEDCLECSCMMQGSSPRGYVPMAPISSDDGYVDMSPKGRNNRTSPSESMSSITSGTPSTDMRFVEYPLEKVSAYFTPSEDETSSVDRPIRTYSVGSRLEVKKKTGDVGNFPDSRVRAFSVGSKSKKTYNRVLPPHGHHIHPKPKSSSAPLLSNTRLHNGDDPMDDLMELDFSKSSKDPYVDMTIGTASKSTPEGYVEMRPALPDGLRFHDNLRYLNNDPPYADMHTSSSPPRIIPNNDYMHMSAFSNGVRAPSNDEYVDMDMRNKNNKHIHTSTDLRPSFSWSQSDYMEMNFQNKLKSSILTGSPKNLSGSPSSAYSMDMGCQNCQHMRSEGLKPPSTNTDTGYVEMTVGKANSHHQRQSSLDSAKVSLDGGTDYSDMSGSCKRKERRGSKRENKKSQPISIQPPITSSQYQQNYPKNSSSISPVYSSLQIGRKHSTGTPPKMYLPLFSTSSGSYPSLPRQRMKKNNHKDSKDSSSSSLTTPSSSSTIFPISLNSPSSPIKPQTSAKTSDMSTSAAMAASGNVKIPSAIINIKYNPISKGAFCSKDDYTIMDFEKCRTNSNSSESDYVNFNPIQKSKERERRPVSDSLSDYAVMKSGVSEISPKNDRNNVVAKVPSPSTLTPQISSLELNMSGNRCFRPITEPRDETVSPRPGDVAPTKLQENMEVSNSTPKNSRPNSVIEGEKLSSVVEEKSRPSSRPSSTSSETGSTTSTLVNSRPPSVSSSSLDGQLHYATLDLVAAPAEDDSGSPSPRFLKNHASFGETNSANVGTDGSGFLYAEIDFVKSEGLKQNTMPANTKVKH